MMTEAEIRKLCKDAKKDVGDIVFFSWNVEAQIISPMKIAEVQKNGNCIVKRLFDEQEYEEIDKIFLIPLVMMRKIAKKQHKKYIKSIKKYEKKYLYGIGD